MTRCVRRSSATPSTTAQLQAPAGAPLVADDEVTGLCGYTQPRSPGRVYALGMTDAGEMMQWDAVREGRRARRPPAAQRRRSARAAEYCVVDDANGTMYYADEDARRHGAAARAGNRRRRARSSTSSRRTAASTEEVKGIALVAGPDGQALPASWPTRRRSASTPMTLRASSIGRFADRRPAEKSMPSARAEGIALAPIPMGELTPEGVLASPTRTTTAQLQQHQAGRHGARCAARWRSATQAQFADPRAQAVARPRAPSRRRSRRAAVQT